MFLNVYSAGKDMGKIKPKNVFMWIFENKIFARLLVLLSTNCWDYPAVMLE